MFYSKILFFVVAHLVNVAYGKYPRAGQSTNLNPTLSEACDTKCPSYKNIEVCFLSKDLDHGLKLSKPGSCQGISDVRTIADSAEILTELKKIAAGCKRISKLVFHGHGNSAKIIMGTNIFSDDWEKLDPNLSCVFADKANVDLRSCNIGNGCDGQRQMYDIAKSFFGDKSGTVIAPTAYATADLLGISKAVSINGKDRTLRYLGQNTQPVYGYDGLLLSTPAAHQVCMDEINELKKRVQQVEKLLKKHACAEDFSYYRIAVHDLESSFSDPNVKMSPGSGTMSGYSYRIEKAAVRTLSACLKDNYLKKLSTSTRAEDQEYLRHLLDSDQTSMQPYAPKGSAVVPCTLGFIDTKGHCVPSKSKQGSGVK